MHPTVPVWPFAILAVLLALGHRQSLDRTVRPATLAKIAIVMGVLSLAGVATAFGMGMVSVLAWATGLAAAVLLGGPAFAPRGLAFDGEGVRVPGSWVPLGLMMGIFMTKFGLGFAAGTGAHVLQESWFIALVSAAFGFFSGALTARAVAVHRFIQAR